jgi:hypothetical protein
VKSLIAAIIGVQLIILSSYTCRAQSVEDDPLPTKVVDSAMELWKDKDLGRYMEKGCKTIKNWANWEAFEVSRCTYKTEDKHDATVIMLNPTRELLVKWVVASCAMKYGLANETLLGVCSGDLLKWIFLQSGSQFVIAGLVDEGGAYSFRDGLAVKLKLLPARWIKPVTKEYQDASLDQKSAVAKYGDLARIASTRREWFAKFEKEYLHQVPTDTSDEKFLAVIRTVYQDAWKRATNLSLPETVGKYRNDLIAAYHFR